MNLTEDKFKLGMDELIGAILYDQLTLEDFRKDPDHYAKTLGECIRKHASQDGSEQIRQALLSAKRWMTRDVPEGSATYFAWSGRHVVDSINEALRSLPTPPAKEGKAV